MDDQDDQTFDDDRQDMLDAELHVHPRGEGIEVGIGQENVYFSVELRREEIGMLLNAIRDRMAVTAECGMGRVHLLADVDDEDDDLVMIGLQHRASRDNIIWAARERGSMSTILAGGCGSEPQVRSESSSKCSAN